MLLYNDALITDVVFIMSFSKQTKTSDFSMIQAKLPRLYIGVYRIIYKDYITNQTHREDLLKYLSHKIINQSSRPTPTTLWIYVSLTPRSFNLGTNCIQVLKLKGTKSVTMQPYQHMKEN